MKKHFFFDMDGTLTPSRQQMSREMSDIIGDLRVSPLKRGESDTLDIIIVSGASMAQIRTQIGGGPYAWMAQNGNDSYFQYDHQAWRNELTWMQKFKVFALIKHLMIGAQHDNVDDLVEDRGCQISYSATGHHAPLEQKRAYDPDCELRIQIIEDNWGWFKELNHYGIQWAIGGTTCIDFYTKTKGENVKAMIEKMGWDPDECIYIGDALFEGGNDGTVIGVIDTKQVKGPDDTLVVIKSFL